MTDDIVLLPGLWLRSSVWDAVAEDLTAAGHRPVLPALPGVDDGDRAATLDDQLATVLASVDAADRPVVVVGHSAAATLAWLAADRRPEKVSRVVMIGGFPSKDGEAYADFFPLDDGVMPFPGWEPFEGPDAADLDDAARERLAAGAVPVAGGVAHGVVHWTDPRRFAVPATLICPEFTPADAKDWIAAGELPELAAATALELVDIDSGHWPMVTRPAELAVLLAAAASA